MFTSSGTGVALPGMLHTAVNQHNRWGCRQHLAMQPSAQSVFKHTHAPPPPAHTHPITPAPLTMLCAKKFMPVPGVSQPPFSPLKPSVTAYMTFNKSLLKPKRSTYCATGFLHRSRKCCCSCGRTYLAAVSSKDSGSFSQEGATSSRMAEISS